MTAGLEMEMECTGDRVAFTSASLQLMCGGCPGLGVFVAHSALLGGRGNLVVLRGH